MCQAFQWPVFSASITVMVPKEQYSRAGGMTTLVHYIPEVVAPLSAAFLVQTVGIGRIMAIDLLTFGFAVVMAFLIAIPQPKTSAEGRSARGSLWSESVYGFRYILKRPGLLGLQLVLLVVYFAGIFQWALQSPGSWPAQARIPGRWASSFRQRDRRPGHERLGWANTQDPERAGRHDARMPGDYPDGTGSHAAGVVLSAFQVHRTWERFR